MIRLYINPDGLKPPYPYIMPNMLSRFPWLRWLKRGWCKHVIIDAGVELLFFVRKYKDYPSWYWRKFRKEVAKARRQENVWVVIPDYPDDYYPGLTHECGLDNVDKTFRNIERWIHVDGVNWLPVIQSKFLDRESFIESCKRMRKYKPERVAIGTVCKTRNLSFIRFCLKTARAYFPNAWIHAFGLTLKALPFARFYINSADSSSHIIWIKYEQRDRGWSHLPRKERITRAANAWINRAKEIMSKPCLEQFSEG